MEIVGQYLQAQALQLVEQRERDYFGRSAFNRFYYATFLSVKAELDSVLPGFPRGHASIPDYLQGAVCKELKNGCRRAQRAGDSELAQLCLRAQSAALDLAELMRKSYGVRVTADYNLNIPVAFGSGDFQLSTVSVNYAKTWPHKARAFALTIASAWKQINV